MKIANIVCTYPPYRGGIGTAACDFACLLKKRGHEVITFTPDYDGEADKKKDKEDGVIRLKTFLKYGNGAFLPQLFCRLKDFDCIYLNYPFFGAQEVVCLLLKFFAKKKKLVIRYHMDVVASSFLAKILSWPSKFIFSFLFSRADLIITASLDYVQNGDLAKVYNEYKEKFVEIPYGVNIEKFKPREKEKDETFKILFVGGLDQAHYFKGLDILFKAVDKLDKEHTDWSLNIVGDGNLRHKYEKIATELGFLDKIIFLGKISDEDFQEKYKEASCLVLPSINKCEAFGIVLIEAMASGIPVIASSLAGVRSVFKDGVEGLMIKPKDSDDLKDKLKYLIDNKDKREEMGEAARKLTEERYNWNKIGNKLEGALLKLTN